VASVEAVGKALLRRFFDAAWHARHAEEGPA
jgi:hypothetical protein